MNTDEEGLFCPTCERVLPPAVEGMPADLLNFYGVCACVACDSCARPIPAGAPRALDGDITICMDCHRAEVSDEENWEEDDEAESEAAWEDSERQAEAARRPAAFPSFKR
jgi:hypothetical protein